jgi:ferritin
MAGMARPTKRKHIVIAPEINDALNAQINEEYYSAYLYLSMAAYYESIDLGGFAHWMYAQYQEELEHGNKLYHYINDRDGRVTLAKIEMPETQWDSPLAPFEVSLAHEQHITGKINQLTALAIQKSDHATQVFLQWFINEQVEEEKTVRDIIHDIKRVANSPDGIFLIDRELASRAAASDGGV